LALGAPEVQGAYFQSFPIQNITFEIREIVGNGVMQLALCSIPYFDENLIDFYWLF
jgi:hypothetical protein